MRFKVEKKLGYEGVRTDKEYILLHFTPMAEAKVWMSEILKKTGKVFEIVECGYITKGDERYVTFESVHSRNEGMTAGIQYIQFLDNDPEDLKLGAWEARNCDVNMCGQLPRDYEVVTSF